MAQLTVISLGWGVQSFGLVAMSALGVLPKVDYAIHGNTGWERSETVAFAKKWTPWVEEHGIEVVMVSAPAGVRDVAGDGITPPFFTRGPDGDGQLYRTCTDRWKIRPMQRWLRQELKRQEFKKVAGAVEQYIGFTLDEIHRVKPSNVRYIVNRYPFLEAFDFPLTRQDVILWLERSGLEVPVKSACVFCPFRRPVTWREIQLTGNGDWQKAVEIDRAIRHKRPGYLCYVCDDRKPLEDHDFTRQMALW